MTVDTKKFTRAPFGNDDVDTKSDPRDAFGNDGEIELNFGNDTPGFVRVRKRSCSSHGATASWSFDVVRAFRVNGKPRHKFMLGLGSQRRIVTDVEYWGDGGSELIRFWMRAIGRMRRHGITEERRRSLVAEMVRKGAHWPTTSQCREFLRVWPQYQAEVKGLMALKPRTGRRA
jgi:hypothetical protein